MKHRFRRLAACMLALLAAYAFGGCRGVAEGLPAAEQEALRFGTGGIWEKSYLDVLDGLKLDEMEIFRECEDEHEFRRVQAENVPVSDYTADSLNFIWHGEALCSYMYCFKKDCSKLNFEHMLETMNEKYGSSKGAAFSVDRITGCGYLMDAFEAYMYPLFEENENWKERIMASGLELLLSTPARIYEWEVGDHTKISMFYCEKNSIAARDAFYIVYANRHDHGGMQMIEMHEARNTDGI